MRAFHVIGIYFQARLRVHVSIVGKHYIVVFLICLCLLGIWSHDYSAKEFSLGSIGGQPVEDLPRNAMSHAMIHGYVKGHMVIARAKVNAGKMHRGAFTDKIDCQRNILLYARKDYEYDICSGCRTHDDSARKRGLGAVRTDHEDFMNMLPAGNLFHAWATDHRHLDIIAVIDRSYLAVNGAFAFSHLNIH